MKKEYEKRNGISYPILWRKKGSTLTDKCKFCNTQHTHGEGEGHRVSHCTDTFNNDGTVSFIMSGYFATDGTYFSPKNGYILREY